MGNIWKGRGERRKKVSENRWAEGGGCVNGSEKKKKEEKEKEVGDDV